MATGNSGASIRFSIPSWTKQIRDAKEFSTAVSLLSKGYKQYADLTARTSRTSPVGSDRDREKVNSFSKAIGVATGALEGWLAHLNKGPLVMLGLGTSITGLIHSAHEMNMRLSGMADQLTYLSTATGSTGKAMDTMFTAWGHSLGSMDQVRSAMSGLASTGLDLGKQFTELTALTSSLEQMTGQSATEWAHLTGAMAFNFGATTKELREVTSAVIATGLKGEQLAAVMNVVKKATQDYAYSARDAKEMALAMTKSITSSIAVLNQVGVSADKAGEFIDNMMNPENFQKNIALFGQLGVSADDFFRAMESGQGQLDLMQKTMGGLPELADRLSKIQNPMARFNMAKQLGLPMEIAAKMAHKTRGEIESMMKAQMAKAEEDKALKKKEEQAKANAQRFEDALMMLKMQALQPLMAMVSRFIGPTMNGLSKVAAIFAKITGAIIDKVEPFFQELFVFADKAAGVLLDALNAPDLITGIETIFTGAGRMLVDEIKKHPAISAMLGAFWLLPKLFGIVNKVMTAFSGSGDKTQQSMKRALNASEKYLMDIRGYLGVIAKHNNISSATLSQSRQQGRRTLGPTSRTSAATGGLSAGLSALSGTGGKLGAAASAAGLVLNVADTLATVFPGAAAKAGTAIEGLSASLAGEGSLAAGVTAAAGPAAALAIAVASIAGGVVAANKANEYFAKGLSVVEQNRMDELSKLQSLDPLQKKELETLQKKLASYGGLKMLTEQEQKLVEIANLKLAAGDKLSKQEEELVKRQQKLAATTDETSAAFTAGFMSFGVAPLIDKIFGTDITGAFARGLDSVHKTVNEYLGAGVVDGLISAWKILPSSWLFTGAKWVYDNWNLLKGAISAIWFDIKWKFMKGFEEIKAGAKSLWDSIVGGITAVWNNITSAAQVAWKYLSNNPVVTFVKNMIDTIKSKLSSIYQWLLNWKERLWSLFPKDEETSEDIMDKYMTLYAKASNDVASGEGSAGELSKWIGEAHKYLAVGSNQRAEFDAFVAEQQRQAREDAEAKDKEMQMQSEANKTLAVIGSNTEKLVDQGKEKKEPDALRLNLDAFSTMSTFYTG